MMHKIKRLGAKGYTFRLDFTVKQVTDLAVEKGQVYVSLTRGPKIRETAPVAVSNRSATWGQTLSVMTTLYKFARSPKFLEKSARIVLKQVVGKSGHRKLGACALDLSDYCDEEEKTTETVLMVEDSANSHKFSNLSIVIKATCFHEKEESDSDSASDVSDMSYISYGEEENDRLSNHSSNPGDDDQNLDEAIQASHLFTDDMAAATRLNEIKPVIMFIRSFIGV